MWACPIGSADEAPCPTLNLQEAMRFKPVASTGVTRRSKQPLRLGGYDVPAGAILMVPFDAVHRCNFERPDDFWPVRACGAGVPARLLRLCTATRERKEARPLPALVLGCAPAGGSCWRAASQSCSIRAPALGLWFCALPVRRAPPRHRQGDSHGPAVSLSCARAGALAGPHGSVSAGGGRARARRRARARLSLAPGQARARRIHAPDHARAGPGHAGRQPGARQRVAHGHARAWHYRRGIGARRGLAPDHAAAGPGHARGRARARRRAVPGHARA